jgi:NAD+-dependent protein deacetylase SIR2
MIVEAHGSFATQRCIECKTEFPDAMMKTAVQAKEVPRCVRNTCDGLVKPDIVFFGEALPEAFHGNRTLPASADLAIVLGTSLTVQPFASLPSFVGEETPRILINLERVGSLGSRADDVLLLGDCDAGVRKLADALDWLDELEELWQHTNPTREDQKYQQLPVKIGDEKLEEEVDQLTRDIDSTLKLSKEQNTWLKDHLSDKEEPEPSASASLENTQSVASSTSSHTDGERPDWEIITMKGSEKQRREEGSLLLKTPDEQNPERAENENNGGLNQVFDAIGKTPEKPSL